MVHGQNVQGISRDKHLLATGAFSWERSKDLSFRLPHFEGKPTQTQKSGNGAQCVWAYHTSLATLITKSSKHASFKGARGPPKEVKTAPITSAPPKRMADISFRPSCHLLRVRLQLLGGDVHAQQVLRQGTRRCVLRGFNIFRCRGDRSFDIRCEVRRYRFERRGSPHLQTLNQTPQRTGSKHQTQPSTRRTLDILKRREDTLQKGHTQVPKWKITPSISLGAKPICRRARTLAFLSPKTGQGSVQEPISSRCPASCLATRRQCLRIWRGV